MTLDGFLTFASLMVAAFAVLGSASRARMALMWKAPAGLSVAAFLLVIYLQQFDWLGQNCPPSFGSACGLLVLEPESPLSPVELSFFVVCLWATAMYFLVRRKKIGVSNLDSLSRYLRLAIRDERFAEAGEILSDNAELVQMAMDKKLRRNELRTLLRRMNTRNFTLAERWNRKFGNDPVERKRQPIKELVSHAYRMVPDGEDAAQDALTIYRQLSRSPEFVSHLAVNEPECVLKLGSSSSFLAEELLLQAFKSMLKNTSSELYVDAADFDGTISRNHEFSDHRILYKFLFSDPGVAETMAIWRPAGDALLDFLREPSADYVRWMNSNSGNPARDSKKDALHAVNCFFEVMIRSAVFHDIKWHMWLFYYRFFVDALLSIHSPEENYQTSEDEFATRLEYGIYSIIKALVGLVQAGVDAGKDSPHRAPKTKDLQHENSNIPKSAAICINQCLFSITRDSSLRSSFRRDLLGIVLQACRDLTRDAPDNPISDVLKRAIIGEGNRMGLAGYRSFVRDAMDRGDPVLLYELNDVYKSLGGG